MKRIGTIRALRLGSAALIVAGLTGTAALGESTKPPASAQKFVHEAASGGMMEVALGKIAAQQASSSDVKEFGQRMVADHTKANDELKDLAARKDITLPKGLDSNQRAEIARLSKLSGHDFDQSYMKAMTTDHVQDVAAFKEAAASSPDTDVKAFAAHTLPTLEDHLTEARRVEAEVNRTAKRGS